MRLEKEFFMTRNVGSVERVVRVGVGLTLLGLTALGEIGRWGWVGVVPLATGLVGTCPAYRLLGVRSCPARDGGHS